MSSTLLYCYNKGCQKQFDAANNSDTACIYHPGAPIFHDATKKWSCCNKGSVDFTQFLQLKGCATGKHNPEKPPEVPKPDKQDSVYSTDVVKETPQPKPLKKERPSGDEPLLSLNKQADQRLMGELEKAMAKAKTECSAPAAVNGEIAVGTSCKKNGCNAVYKGTDSNKEVCFYHPGMPIFHEGMKYWSCCQRKTSEFDNFMSQEGCAQDKHVWIAEDKSASTSNCRHDYMQAKPGFVTIDIFSKLCVPEECSVEANQVTCKVNLTYNAGKNKYAKVFNLYDCIIPSESFVNIRPAKVEIQLKKESHSQWPSLEARPS